MENQKALKKVSDKDLRKVFLHSLAIMCSWNYERQMHMGFMYGMAPVLDKLYADDEERKKEALCRRQPPSGVLQLQPRVLDVHHGHLRFHGGAERKFRRG